MSLVDTVHGGFVFPRRVARLAEMAAKLLPQDASVLDVGCGDGRFASEVMRLRPDLHIEGIDVLVRPETLIPVTKFDGARIPAGDKSFDVVLFVDVLHHTDDPDILLKEAKRVARKSILIKDHNRDGFAAGQRLRFMDWVGNARHGVVLPYNYWPRRRWESEWKTLGLVEAKQQRELHLYPWWADWCFGSGLHFVVQLKPLGSPL